MNRPRAKGTAAETAVVAASLAAGFPDAHRNALHGSRDVGDVWLAPGVIVSVKAVQGIDLAGSVDDLQVQMTQARARHGVVVFKRRSRGDPAAWYAVQPYGRWLALARLAGLGGPD